MKKAINAWAVDGDLNFEEMFAAVKEAGFEGIELNVEGEVPTKHSISMEKGTDLDAIAKLSSKYALPVISISTSLGGGSDLGKEEHKRTHNVIRRQIECAKALGADIVLSVPSSYGGKTPLLEAYKNSLECYRSMGDEIAASGIYVCLEQVWNGFFTSPFDMAKFIDDIDNPYVAAYFDAGNMMAFSWPEYWIEILGNRIRGFHAKNFKRAGGLFQGGEWTSLDEGDVDWPRVMSALRKTGYNSYLTAETFIGETKIPGITYQKFYKMVSESLGRIITWKQ